MLWGDGCVFMGVPLASKVSGLSAAASRGQYCLVQHSQQTQGVKADVSHCSKSKEELQHGRDSLLLGHSNQCRYASQGNDNTAAAPCAYTAETGEQLRLALTQP